MKAAVIRSFDRSPQYLEWPEPSATEGEVKVAVTATALSQLVKAQASGKHYSVSSADLPFVAGVDGVGRLSDGRRVYFAFPRRGSGSFANLTVVKASHVVELPDDLDDVTAAALANPGMSSWAALTLRARFVRGESVLIHGATGASGRLAIRIAKHLGASRIVVTGRTRAKAEALIELGADEAIGLDDPQLATTWRRVVPSIDVVLDYLWGPSAQSLLESIPHGHRLRFVQIGSLAGNTLTLSAAVLRGSAVELIGSGLGSVSNEALVASIGEVLRAASTGGFTVATEAVPLSDVEASWSKETDRRLVFTV